MNISISSDFLRDPVELVNVSNTVAPLSRKISGKLEFTFSPGDYGPIGSDQYPTRMSRHFVDGFRGTRSFRSKNARPASGSRCITNNWSDSAGGKRCFLVAFVPVLRAAALDTRT